MGISRIVKSEDILRECLNILGTNAPQNLGDKAILTMVPFNHVTLIFDGEEIYNKKDIEIVERLADLILPLFMPELTLTRTTGLTVRFTKDEPVEISVSRYGTTDA